MDEKLMNVSNSNKVKNEETKAKIEPPSITGPVKIKKKNGLVKFAEAFLPEDVTDVRTYIFKDIIVPSIKKVIDEVFHVMLWGEDRTLSSRQTNRVSYREYYSKPAATKNKSKLLTDSGSYISDDEEYVFKNRADAEDFLRWMLEELGEYGFIRLSEVNEKFGKTGHWTECDYGWSNLSAAKIASTRDGWWILKLPKPFPIN